MDKATISTCRMDGLPASCWITNMAAPKPRTCPCRGLDLLDTCSIALRDDRMPAGRGLRSDSMQKDGMSSVMDDVLD